MVPQKKKTGAEPLDHHDQDEQEATFWPDASLFGVALIWGLNIPLMKNGLDQVDVYVFNACRLVISAIVLSMFSLRERRRGILPQKGMSFRPVLVYGFLIAGIYQFVFLQGVARTTSGSVALIIATVPMWTAFLALVFIGERLHRIAWLGLGIALLGTIMVAVQTGDVGTGSEHLWGNLLILTSALMWSGGTVYSRPLLKQISPMQLAAASSIIGLSFHLLIAAPRFSSSLPDLMSINLWGIIIYSGVLSTGLAQPMWSYGVKHAGASHAASIQNAIPMIAIIAAWFLRDESITIAQLIGGVLILVGLVIMRSVRRNR